MTSDTKKIDIATPELDKISRVKDQSQSIGQFLEWLMSKYEIGKWGDEDTLYPVNYSIEKWLALYFEIDLQKAETERRAILDRLRIVATSAPWPYGPKEGDTSDGDGESKT